MHLIFRSITSFVFRSDGEEERPDPPPDQEKVVVLARVEQGMRKVMKRRNLNPPDGSSLGENDMAKVEGSVGIRKSEGLIALSEKWSRRMKSCQ